MNFQIQEWPDNTATLMLDDGTHLFTYPSVEEAVSVCEEWYRHHYDGEDLCIQDPSCGTLE